MVRLLAAILSFAALLYAESPTPEQIAQIFAAYQKPDSPGCAVGIETPEHASWTAAYGMADLEHQVANTTATVFEAGSVSKQFTAAAVLLLVERGRVSLDDAIGKYFPELPQYQRPITIRQLLNHTSGLRDWGEVEAIAGWPRGTREYTHAHVLNILSRQRSLNYSPGDTWSYTNSGYNLAAMLVERVSGMTLQAFGRAEFFGPLGMHSTQWRDDFRRVVPNRAIAYDQRDGEWRQNMPFEDVYGNGGLLTTVGDMLAWNRNMATGTLDRAVFETMQKPGSLNNGDTIGYGFGLFLQHFHGLPEVSHAGATAGYRAWLGRIPSKNLSIALACNAASANTTDLAHQLAALFLDTSKPEPPALPSHVQPGLYRSLRDHTTIEVKENHDALTFDGHAVRNPVRFAGSQMIVTDPVFGDDVWDRVEEWKPGQLGAFAGTYASDEAETVLRVAAENGNLVIHRQPDSFVLHPADRDGFKCPLGHVRFLRDGSGKIVALSVSGSRVWDLRFMREGAGVASTAR